jgi:hypothetical protein
MRVEPGRMGQVPEVDYDCTLGQKMGNFYLGYLERQSTGRHNGSHFIECGSDDTYLSDCLATEAYLNIISNLFHLQSAAVNYSPLERNGRRVLPSNSYLSLSDRIPMNSIGRRKARSQFHRKAALV